jgi:tetratricopeptide (TPR) repeat protein
MEGLQEEAVRKFEAALAESPTSLEARMGYGRALAALGRCEQAVKVLADVAGTKETRAAAEEVLGVCYFRLHDYVPALTHLEESVRLAPARKDSTIFLSRANAASGRLKDAVRTLKSWLKRNGDDVDVLYWIGKFNEELAELAYQRMVKANPNHYLVFLLQSEQYIWKKDYVRGLEAIDRAIALAPQAPGLHYTRANILWRQRSLEKAREDLEIELKSNPYHAQANFLLGDIHATMREPKSAIPYLERAVALDPRLWDAHRALGRSYIMENRLGEAIQHFQIVADANPTDATIHGLLSNAYRRMGDVEKAVEESRIFQKLSAERRERVPKPTIEEPPELAPQP